MEGKLYLSRWPKKLNHTEDSFLPIKFVKDSWFYRAHPNDDWSLTYIGRHLSGRNVLVYLTTWGCLLLTAAATSFLIIPLSKNTGPTWSGIMGSYGLFVSLASSSVLWSYVYIREQFPATTVNHEYELNTMPRRLDHFAIIQHPVISERHLLTICDLHAIDGTLRRICKFISFLMSATISLGYIHMQYTTSYSLVLTI